MNSSRLRAIQVCAVEPTTAITDLTETVDETTPAIVPALAPILDLQQQIMQPSPLQANLPVLKKAPYNYVVGEKCMAKWTDSRRWRATVQTVLDLGKYI